MSANSTSGRVQLSLRFREDLAEVLREQASGANRSVNNYLENLLLEYFGLNEDSAPSSTTNTSGFQTIKKTHEERKTVVKKRNV